MTITKQRAPQGWPCNASKAQEGASRGRHIAGQHLIIAHANEQHLYKVVTVDGIRLRAACAIFALTLYACQSWYFCGCARLYLVSVVCSTLNRFPIFGPAAATFPAPFVLVLCPFAFGLLAVLCCCGCGTCPDSDALPPSPNVLWSTSKASCPACSWGKKRHGGLFSKAILRKRYVMQTSVGQATIEGWGSRCRDAWQLRALPM